MEEVYCFQASNKTLTKCEVRRCVPACEVWGGVQGGDGFKGHSVVYSVLVPTFPVQTSGQDSWDADGSRAPDQVWEGWIRCGSVGGGSSWVRAP